jgi:hypothetical protein
LLIVSAFCFALLRRFWSLQIVNSCLQLSNGLVEGGLSCLSYVNLVLYLVSQEQSVLIILCFDIKFFSAYLFSLFLQFVNFARKLSFFSFVKFFDPFILFFKRWVFKSSSFLKRRKFHLQITNFFCIDCSFFFHFIKFLV